MAQQQTGLNKGYVQVGLNAGLNRKRDAHQLQNGELLTADNVVYSAVDGQVTKRFGYSIVQPQGAPFQGGPFVALGCRDEIEPLILGRNTFNRYNTNQNLSTSIPLQTQGRLYSQPVVGSTGQTTYPWPPSHAHVAVDDSGKYACVTWEEPNTNGALCFYGVQDQQTGAWIISPRKLTYPATYAGYTFAAYAQPQVNYYNGNFYLSMLWSGNQSNFYACYVLVYLLPLTNLASGVQGLAGAYLGQQDSTNTTQLLTTHAYTYDLHVSAGRFALAMFPTATANQSGNLRATAVLGTLQGAQLSANSTQTLSLPSNSSNGNNNYTLLRFAAKANGPAAAPYMIGTEVAIWTFDANGNASQYTLPNTYSNTYFNGSPVDITYANGSLFFTSYGVMTNGWACMYLYMGQPGFDSATSVRITSPVGTALIEQLSRLFVLPNGRVCFWLGAGSGTSDNTYNSAFLMEVDPNNPTAGARCISRTQYLANYKNNYFDKTTPCEVYQIAGTQQYVTFLSAGSEKAAAAGGATWRAYGVLNRVTFDYAPARQVQVQALPPGGNLIGGAYPLYYDGNELVEAGFSAAPDYTQCSPNTAGFAANVHAPSVSTTGGSIVGTTSSSYTYLCCFVRRDAYGNVLRSAPSSPISVSIPSGSTNQVAFYPFYYAGGGNVRIEYYRNTPTLAGQGTYYYVGSAPVLSPSNSTFAYFYDNLDDGSITGGRTLNTAETPNDPPPAMHHMALSDTRAYCIPADNRNQVWASKLFTPGRTVEWSSSQYVTEGQNAGLFTGVAVLDANVIVFKADSICYFYGSGPDNSGSNGGFSALQKLATDVGCIDAASIKVTPEGVVFRSRRGIELLNRSLQLQYIGDPVEPIVQTLGPLSSVVIMPNYTELRFIPANAAEPVLCYDYGAKRWSTFGQGATGLSCWASVQAANLQGIYWWISQDGTTVNVETNGQYLDAGQPIVMTLETAEIPVGAAGPQGWGRLYRLALMGGFYSDHILNVSFQYDHASTYTDTVQFDTRAGLINGDNVYQFRCSRVPRQRMQTVRLMIQDSAVTGQSCAISSLVLEVGDKAGLARLSSAKSL